MIEQETKRSPDLSNLSTVKLFGKIFQPADDEGQARALVKELVNRYNDNQTEAIVLYELLARIHECQGAVPQFSHENLKRHTPRFPKKIFNTIAEVPRHEFFPNIVKKALLEISDQARENIERSNFIIALKPGITLSEPILVSQMALLLNIKSGDRVLDVGSGLGYHAAVLAKLATNGRVYGVERDLEAVKLSRRTLKRLGYSNVEIHHADGGFGLKDKALFDKINVAFKCKDFPEELLLQLKIGGRMVIPIESEVKASGVTVTNELLYLVERKSEAKFERHPLWNVFFVPMQEGVNVN